MVTHATYLDIWHSMKDRIFMERHPIIDLDNYFRWYLPIICWFITLYGHVFLGIHIIRYITSLVIQDRINWYVMTFYITFIKYHAYIIIDDEC